MAFRWRKESSSGLDVEHVSADTQTINRSLLVEQFRIDNILGIGNLAMRGSYGRDSEMIRGLTDQNLMEISTEHSWSYDHVRAGYPVDWLEEHRAAS